jgi:hypothetical protein
MTTDTPPVAAGRFITRIYKSAYPENSFVIAFAKADVCKLILPLYFCVNS